MTGEPATGDTCRECRLSQLCQTKDCLPLNRITMKKEMKMRKTGGKAARMVAMTVMAAGTALAAGADDKVEATIATDFVSQYYWRGQDLGDISVQPTLGIGWKGLSLTAWGSVGLSDHTDTKEFDLTAAYEVKGFHVGVTDYWFNSPREKYFAYRNDNTSHVFEGNLGYDFGFLSVNWFTNFAGNDGVNKSGKRAYSSYLELAAPFRLAKCDWTASVGAVPYATTFYAQADGFAVTHVSLKACYEVPVTEKFRIPLFAQVSANPSTGKAYFTAGLTLKAF